MPILVEVDLRTFVPARGNPDTQVDTHIYMYILVEV